MKSNLGHTQSAGGVGGVIKMVMAMRHGLLPKTLHVDTPSRFIDWSSGAMSLLVEPVPWVKNGEPRRAAVHSFGMSGTNVHVILEEPPPLQTPPPPRERSGRTLVPWPISGRGEDGLRRQAQRLGEFLAEHPEIDDIADVGRSLAARPALSHRAVPIGASRAELLASVESLAEGRSVAEATQPVPEALESLAQAWVAGSSVDWEPVFAELDARPVRLPTYAFARRRHWVEQSPLWEGGGPIVKLGQQVSAAVGAPASSAPAHDEVGSLGRG
jgi:acyl transferase domain-containing protein